MGTNNNTSTKKCRPTDSDRFHVQFTATASLVSLSLAQVFLILGVWLLAWPGTIIVPFIGHGFIGLTGFLSGLSLIGFYLGFLSLWRNSATIDR